MKGQILLIFYIGALLSACSAPQQTRTAPLDMQTVNDYNDKVYSGNTVPPAQRINHPKQTEIPLNSSDRQPKRKMLERVQPHIILVPSIGYYGRAGYYGYYRDNW